MSNKSKSSKPSKKKFISKKKNEPIYDDDDDVEDFENSDDEEYASQSGGDDKDASINSELGSDSATLDIDPDDEEDPNDDEKYDPAEDEELEEPDEETNSSEEDIYKETDEKYTESDEEYSAGTKPCHMKDLNKDFIVLDEDDSNMYGKMEYKKILNEDRETDSILTYYEMVRIIGTRAQQFNFGVEPLVRGIEGLHPAKMAYVELIARMTPFIIRRHLPGKKYEEWRIDELTIIHSITDDFFVPENFGWDSLMKEANKLNNNTTTISPEKNNSKSSETNITKKNPNTGSKRNTNTGSKRNAGSKRNINMGSKRRSTIGSKRNTNTRSKRNTNTRSKRNTNTRSKRNPDSKKK